MAKETPDQAIVSSVFHEFKEQNYPDLSVGEAFERFAASLALKKRSPTAHELESGLVGNTEDGGIDCFHVYIGVDELVTKHSRTLTRRKDALRGLAPGVPIDVYILQAKHERKWDTNVFHKLRSSLEVIFDPTCKESELREFPLNPEVVEAALNLRKLRKHTAQLAPRLHLHVAYYGLAPQANVDNYMKTKRRQLETALKKLLPSGSKVDVDYIGDSKIVEQTRETADFTSTLVFDKAPVRYPDSYVGMVSISDYLKFIRHPKSKQLRQEMFAVNVRDYAGSNIQVNSAIGQTLETDNRTKFWWLNNGITMLADQAHDPIENEWELTNPMVVNGLQTSHVIHEKNLSDTTTIKRSKDLLLVRIVTESDPEVREAIIAGTNNQSTISSIQLHANDDKLVRIEGFLRAHGWHFERRRHQFRGMRRPAQRVRNILDLAQAVLAYRHLDPDTARARPTDRLSKRSGWNTIFGSDVPEELYLNALDFTNSVNVYLRTDRAIEISGEPANTRFYLVSGVALAQSGAKSLEDYLKIPVHDLPASPPETLLAKVHTYLNEKVNEFDDGNKSRDRIYKGRALRDTFLEGVLTL